MERIPGGMGERRNILQMIGSITNLSRLGGQEEESNKQDKADGKKEVDLNNLDSIDTEREATESKKKMNMKQEGPFLVPQLWKDSMNLENITNDFLESNVTGEVMNLDDFLKELQVNELVQQNEELQRGGHGGQLTSPPGVPPHHMAGGHHPEAHQAVMQDQDQRFQSLIRPANIDSLKEPSHPVRPSIMHHVGKPPDLHLMHNPSHIGGHHGQGEGGSGGVSLPSRGGGGDHEGMGGLLSPKDHPGGQGGIPQASVRPLMRPVIMASSKEEHGGPARQEDTKPPSASKENWEAIYKERMRMSEPEEDDSEEDDEEDERMRGQNFGGFTSTVCVNFSQDDLRLATIPGQEGDFDPATRRFSEEELKPQPIIRKRKKQFVPDELKNNKYWAKRCKNNEAAKRSREARRLKENQIAMRARFLEEENTALKGEVDHLKKENSELKNMMLALEEKLNHMVAESR